MKQPKSFTISIEAIKKLETKAKKKDRTMSYIVDELILKYL